MPDEHGRNDIRPVSLAPHKTGQSAGPNATKNRAAAGEAGDVPQHARQIHHRQRWPLPGKRFEIERR